MTASNGRPATASTVDVDKVDVSADKDGEEEEKDKKKEEPQKMVGTLEVVSRKILELKENLGIYGEKNLKINFLNFL